MNREKRVEEQTSTDMYRKINIIGKGSFGYAILVSLATDKSQLYVMKVIES